MTRAAIRSDYQSWVLLSSGQKSSLTPLEVYKSCVIAANNGWKRNEEQGLGPYQKALLETRRQLKAGRFEPASKILASLKLNAVDSPIDLGDREFLKGMILHRVGDQKSASARYLRAAQLFSDTGDSHRVLRSLINEKISSAENLQAYLAGDLYVLQRQAIQAGYHDLAGNVFCARTGELIVAQRYVEAVAEATEAIAHYRLAACPEDLAQAQMMLAIAQYLSGDPEGAKLSFQSVHIRDGKISPYTAILEALLTGKRPTPPPGHPLAATSWTIQKIKTESVTGKILRRLSESPATRDQLIVAIWGERATHPSYCNRLYSAIHQLRKTTKSQILFNGEKYVIVR